MTHLSRTSHDSLASPQQLCLKFHSNIVAMLPTSLQTHNWVFWSMTLDKEMNESGFIFLCFTHDVTSTEIPANNSRCDWHLIGQSHVPEGSLGLCRVNIRWHQRDYSGLSFINKNRSRFSPSSEQQNKFNVLQLKQVTEPVCRLLRFWFGLQTKGKGLLSAVGFSAVLLLPECSQEGWPSCVVITRIVEQYFIFWQLRLASVSRRKPSVLVVSWVVLITSAAAKLPRIHKIYLCCCYWSGLYEEAWCCSDKHTCHTHLGWRWSQQKVTRSLQLDLWAPNAGQLLSPERRNYSRHLLMIKMDPYVMDQSGSSVLVQFTLVQYEPQTSSSVVYILPLSDFDGSLLSCWQNLFVVCMEHCR